MRVCSAIGPYIITKVVLTLYRLTSRSGVFITHQVRPQRWLLLFSALALVNGHQPISPTMDVAKSNMYKTSCLKQYNYNKISCNGGYGLSLDGKFVKYFTQKPITHRGSDVSNGLLNF